jgi:hypothetical protein
MADFEFPIEKGHIITFARSLGESNPLFFDHAGDRESAASIVAPPTFVQASIRFAPDHPLRPRPGMSSQGDEQRTGRGGGTQLHAEQHFEYRRRVVAGETLNAVSRTGATWQKQGRRGGTLTFNETFVDYVGADGEVAITARTVGVVTSQVVEGT